MAKRRHKMTCSLGYVQSGVICLVSTRTLVPRWCVLCSSRAWNRLNHEYYLRSAVPVHRSKTGAIDKERTALVMVMRRYAVASCQLLLILLGSLVWFPPSADPSKICTADRGPSLGECRAGAETPNVPCSS